MQTSVIVGVVVTLLAALIFGGIALFNALESGHLGHFLRPHTIMMLDKSIEIIERYKNTRGEYPDSLDRTKAYLKEGEIFPDMDFMGPLKLGERVRHFYYELKDNGEDYYLFGVGMDSKPFSEDDVYPTDSAIEKSDGFKKPKPGA